MDEQSKVKQAKLGDQEALVALIMSEIQYTRKAIFQGEGNEFELHIGQLVFSKKVEGAKINIPLK